MFYTNDWFGKTIIKLNKKKIWPFINLKTDKFLREIIASNVLVLWKSKEVIARVTNTTKHENRHAVVETYNNVIFVVKLLISEKAFEKILDCGSGDHAGNINTDLFQKEMVALAESIFLHNYICWAWENWTQAGAQTAKGDGEIEQDLFNKNLYNLVKRVSIYDNDNKEKSSHSKINQPY